MNFVQICDYIVRPKIQIVLFIMTIFLAFIMARTQQNSFVALESHPELKYVTPQILKQWGSDPSVVYVGLYINNFPKFQMETNNFTADAIIWFNYDPAHVSTETISKFAFEKGEVLSKSAADSRLIETRLLTQFEIRIQFSSNINYTLFPLDDHRIYLSMFNSALSPRSTIFKSEKQGFTVAKGASIEGWNYVDTHIAYGYDEAKLQQQDEKAVILRPKVIFSIDLRRAGIRLISLILIPLFLIFFISLFTLSFDPKTHASNMLSLALAGLSSAISYRFVIQNLSPPNVGYFILGDHIFSILLFFIFMNFIVCIMLVKKGELSGSWSIIRGVLLLFFHTSFLLAWDFFLFHWVSK